jgi:hypothetical protein
MIISPACCSVHLAEGIVRSQGAEYEMGVDGIIPEYTGYRKRSFPSIVMSGEYPAEDIR